MEQTHNFKDLITSIYKALNNLAPIYISDLIEPCCPSRSLRSKNKFLLAIPRSNHKTYRDGAFFVVVPRLWNGN